MMNLLAHEGAQAKHTETADQLHSDPGSSTELETMDSQTQCSFIVMASLQPPA